MLMVLPAVLGKCSTAVMTNLLYIYSYSCHLDHQKQDVKNFGGIAVARCAALFALHVFRLPENTKVSYRMCVFLRKISAFQGTRHTTTS